MESLLKTISQLSEDVAGDALLSVLEEVAEPIRATAARLAPLDTGTLRDSIVVKPIQNRRTGAVSVGVGTTGEGFYGRFHEYGTRYMPARPFLRPAFDRHKDNAERRIGSLMWDLIAEQGTR